MIYVFDFFMTLVISELSDELQYKNIYFPSIIFITYNKLILQTLRRPSYISLDCDSFIWQPSRIHLRKKARWSGNPRKALTVPPHRERYTWLLLTQRIKVFLCLSSCPPTDTHYVEAYRNLFHNLLS